MRAHWRGWRIGLMVNVLSPVAGTRPEVSDVPDPVFAAGMVGPGAAIAPHHGKQGVVLPPSTAGS